MKEEFETYTIDLIGNIPHYIYEGMLSVFCIVSILLYVWKGKNALSGIVKFLLAEYVFLIYCSTVIFRRVLLESKYNLTPFWSYSQDALIPENIMNVVVFVPVGALLFVTTIGQRRGWLTAILSGVGLSIGIELLQFVFRKGFSEVDDVIHNTLGCAIGYGICIAVSWMYWRCYCMICDERK